MAALGVAVFCACGSGGDQGKKIVLGVMVANDVDVLSQLQLDAIRLAVEHINAAGVFDLPLEAVNYSPARGDFIDPEKVEKIVKDLHDIDGAVAYVSNHGRDNSLVQNRVTNQPEYSDFVRCSGTSAEPTSNLPGYEDSDRSDTFYRTILNQMYQIDRGAELFMMKNWLRLGFVHLNDSVGNSSSLYIQMKVGEYAARGMKFVFDMAVPPGDFVLEDNRAKLDELIELSHGTGIDVLVMGTFQAQTNGIIKYLTENDFRGMFILSIASFTSDLFAIAKAIPDWLKQPSNNIFLFTPDTCGGKHCLEFNQMFRERLQQEPALYSVTSYECAFVIGLAMVYSGQNSPTRLGVKENMRQFKEKNYTGSETEVGIGAQEFARAAQLIREGKRVDFAGASGRIFFDENGDRPTQGMCLVGPNATVTGWENKECFDENMEPL